MLKPVKDIINQQLSKNNSFKMIEGLEIISDGEQEFMQREDVLGLEYIGDDYRLAAMKRIESKQSLNTISVSTKNLNYKRLTDQSLVKAIRSLEYDSEIENDNISICTSTNTIYKDLNTRLQKIY